MRRYLGLALAGVLAAISVSAVAMGLGEIRLNSYLNQRLDAEIELVSAAADEIESLEIRLADDAVFQRYGLERTAFMNNLTFQVERRPNGTAYVHVTSSEPVREPFLTLLVVADWSRGRLMREYTLLIDPPTFAGREEAAVQPQPQPEVPATAPVPEVQQEPVVRQEVTPEPERQPAEPEQRAEETTGDVISIPPLEADAQPIRREAPQAQPEPGGSYGPIQRNETLWGIAQRLRPDESVTINQMMLALYRANPEAFQGNINRLKAGYVLRIPEYSELSALARRDAFNEVKRQNEEWRTGPVPAQPSVDTAEPVDVEPELSLVAPEEDIETDAGLGVGAGGEADDLDLGTEDPLDLAEDDIDDDAVDLGTEEESTERLLDIEDESLQAMQEQEDSLESAQVADDMTDDAIAPETGETAGETFDEATGEETLEEPAVETAPEVAPALDEPVAEETAPVVQPVRAPEPTLVEKLTAIAFSPLGLGIGAVILVLLLAGFLVVRKRSEAAKGRTAAAMAEWVDGEDEGDVTVVAGRDEDDVTIVTGHGADDEIATVFSHGMDHEDTGTTRLDEDAAATQMLEAENARTPDSQPDFTETVVGGQQPVTLDENDPLSEADFHMAYGLYDQAAEVVEKAIQRDPSRKEYHAKLAEIHFAGNNTDGFLESAQRLKELAGPGDPAWDNIAIMGRQIAPDNALFAEAGSAASVDLDFGSAAEEFDEPEASPSSATSTAADESLDFDLDLDGGKPTEESASAEDSAGDGLDFDLELDAEAPLTAEAEPAAEPAADDFDFDLGETETPATAENAESFDDAPLATGEDYDTEQTQTEFDKALQELSAFVDTNIPEQDAGDAVDEQEDAGLNLDDYSFSEDAGGLDDELGGTGEGEEDIGEIGTKLDLARAYIDMGDPDGARGILEEVVSDGDAEQQREARELLDQLG